MAILCSQAAEFDCPYALAAVGWLVDWIGAAEESTEPCRRIADVYQLRYVFLWLPPLTMDTTVASIYIS